MSGALDDLFGAGAPDTQKRIVPVMVPMPAPKPYSYAVPEGMHVEPGSIVQVPLGPRQVIGVVWDEGEENKVEAKKLRPITLAFECPPLKPDHRRFLEWVAHYTLSPPGLVARMALRAPAGFDPEPMVEGRIILQKLLRGGGGIRARLSGERAPRAFPRFGVGLQGKSTAAGNKESTFQFRATPSLKKLEFIEQFAEQDHARAEAPWTWREGVPLWLEIRAQPAAEGCALEGRAWAEGEPRPETASISVTVPLNPSLMKATIHATPFALKPVVIEKVERISGGAAGADES